MSSNSPQTFVVIELKNTHHVLGLLSRDADSAGGKELEQLVPLALSVRAPVVDPQPNPTVPPPELHVRRDLLQAVSASNSTFNQRDQAFSNPQGCVFTNGTVVPIQGITPPSVKLGASAGSGVVADFTVNIVPSAGAEDLPYTVLIEEAKAVAGADPFFRITEGKIPANSSSDANVTIRSGPGDAPPDPVPTNRDVYVLIAVAGRPLALHTDQTK
ncbi:hypothetical protein [Paraburkholderia terrae]